MRILTAAECRAEILKFPAELQGMAATVAYSLWDEGLSCGLIGAARATNPMRSLLPPPAEQAAKSKSKAR